MAIEVSRPTSGRQLVTSAPRDRAAEERAQTVADFLATAMDRFRLVEESESELRRKIQRDVEFLSSEQWEPNIKSDRNAQGRPCLTVNRLNGFVKLVVNQARSARPAVQIHGADDAADQDLAEVYQGLVRSIERNSKADSVAYGWAMKCATESGRGFLKIEKQYVHERSFRQELVLKRVRNPLCVYVGPCDEPDYSDATFALIVADLTNDEFEARYQDADLASLAAFRSSGNAPPSWVPKDGVRIAEYYYVEYSPDTLYQFRAPDGSYVELFKSELEDPETMPEGLLRVNDRPVLRRQVKVAVINAVEILEGNETKTAGRDWEGYWIPIVPIIGDEIDVDGTPDLRGLVRDAIDAQRMFNYWWTAATEKAAFDIGDPFVGPEGFTEGHEDDWNDAHLNKRPWLEYKPTDHAGELVPPPRRDRHEAAIAAFGALIQQADNNLKAATSIYDASLGERGPQESGRAIRERKVQGDITNANYLDGMSLAIWHTGRILVDLIPHIYDAAQVRRIIGSDEQEKLVMVYAGAARRPSEVPKTPDGQPDIQGPYDLSVGKYDVAVSAGPSMQTKREETVATLMDLFKSNEQLLQISADILFENMDVPWGRQLAKRAKKLLPPGIREEDEEAQIPPEVQQQLQAMQQQYAAVAEQLQAAQQELQNRREQAQLTAQTKQAEIESRERMAQEKIVAEQRSMALKIELEMAKITAGINRDQVNAQLTELKTMIDALKVELDQEARDLDRAQAAREREQDRAQETPPAPEGA